MGQIEALDTNKSNCGKLRTSIIITTKNIVCPYLNNCINSAIYKSQFLSELKEANVSSIFKNTDATLKSNLRPISVLLLVSKIYERILIEQISPYVQNKLSNLLSGFSESCSTQNALIRDAGIM